MDYLQYWWMDEWSAWWLIRRWLNGWKVGFLVCLFVFWVDEVIQGLVDDWFYRLIAWWVGWKIEGCLKRCMNGWTALWMPTLMGELTDGRLVKLIEVVVVTRHKLEAMDPQVTSNVSRIPNHESRVTSHASQDKYHRPWVISHKQGIISHETRVMSHKPGIISRESQAMKNKPRAANHGIISHKPIYHRPGTTRENSQCNKTQSKISKATAKKP